MRIFQNFGIYPVYMKRLHARTGAVKHSVMIDAVLEDRFVALHMLKPILEKMAGDFVVGDDKLSQRAWARENGLSPKVSLDDILLAQIEASGAEIFYNMDPHTFAGDFAKKLPGNVKKKIAWRAAPSPGLDLSGYDLIVCNFPSILQSYRQRGWKAKLFYPAFDPQMARYRAASRTADVVFVGSYSRHHVNRAQIINELASLQNRYRVNIHLNRSRLTRFAETPLGFFAPLSRHRLPPILAKTAKQPVFGRALYSAFGNSRIVINGAIDMSGFDRGNMRCWEALGCGAVMLSDRGNYPPGFIEGETMLAYDGVSDLRNRLEEILADEGRWKSIATAGQKMVESLYSKDRQWNDFVNLL